MTPKTTHGLLDAMQAAGDAVLDEHLDNAASPLRSMRAISRACRLAEAKAMLRWLMDPENWTESMDDATFEARVNGLSYSDLIAAALRVRLEELERMG